MKRIFFALICLAAFVACENGTDSPEPTPNPGGTETPENPEDKPSEEPDFVINVHDNITAWSVAFDVLPAKQSAPYYFDIISKARLGEVDIKALKSEINSSAEMLATYTGSTVEEVLGSMLSVGDRLDFVSDAGYKGEVTYCVYAFYWNEEDGTELVTCEFTTPAAKASSEDLLVNISDVDSYSMVVSCTPSAGVERYYYYFDETAKVDLMFRELADDNAYLSYHAMNVGTKYEGEHSFEQKGLKPDVGYTAVVMAIDKKGNRFLVRKDDKTATVVVQERVESELFEALLGEWSGVQSVTDNYNPAYTSEFNVTIVGALDDYDYDYRAENQLVALVDGWCNIAYYSVSDLIAEGVEEPEEKFGPKWLLNIAEGDVVTVDGKAHHSVLGWYFGGYRYLVSAPSDGSAVYTNDDFTVTVSADKNTITISSPIESAYPSLYYQMDGVGWMGHQWGCSDIVLTRK